MVTPLLSPVSETRAGLVYMVEGPVGIAKGARQGVPQVDRMILLFRVRAVWRQALLCINR